MQEDLASLFKQNMQLSRSENIPQIVLTQGSPMLYSPSQHYHHSAHQASPSIDEVANMTQDRDEYLTRVGSERGADGNQPATAVQSPTSMEIEERRHDGTHDAEPYVRSGYELLAERDYKRQAAPSPGKEMYNPLGTAVGYRHAVDPAFTGREWWRNFVDRQPTEFQYGTLEQINRLQHADDRMEEDQDMH